MCRCYGRRISPAYRKPHTSWERPAVFTGGVTYSRSARTTTARLRIRWLRVAVLVAVIAATGAVLGTRRSLPSASSSASHAAVLHPHRGDPGRPPLRGDGAVVPSQHSGALGESDGAIPDGTTVFDDHVPGVAKLDPALLHALRLAAGEAGVQFVVDSGWRSAPYQERLLQAAIAKYGSLSGAARWVAPPGRSAHVKGQAVDLASAPAAWLRENGAKYGLCQVYGNEPWHFELRPEAPAQGCPAIYADPTHDPRMQ